MNLFDRTIKDWSSWGKVFQSIDAFEPLIRHIYETERLPFAAVENLKPGTNAVFRVGGTVVKILAPKESGMDARSDYDTELFGLNRVNARGVFAPKLLASGCVHDRYDFLYLVTEFIDAEALGDVEQNLTDAQKERIGHMLRAVTGALNTPCERFNHWDPVERASDNGRWRVFPDSLNRERLAFLRTFPAYEPVYVHGDLTPDNVLLDKDNLLHIIDFADALLAPAPYELAALVCELFCFEKPYMRGYFEDYDPDILADQCLEGILLHDFGADIIRLHLGKPDEITSIEILRERILFALRQGKGFVND